MPSRLCAVAIAIFITTVGLLLDNVTAETKRTNVRFHKIQLTKEYYCDGVATGDIDRDGKLDIVAGPFWYAGPTFQERRAFYKPVPLQPEPSPSNSMFSFVHDLNGDGHQDIIVLGRVHKHAAAWYQNPGAQGHDQLWQKHYVFERVRGESPNLTDLNGDGEPEIICHWDGRWGWIHPQSGQPTAAWKFHPLGEMEDWPQFYHGEGTGDLNGDGRLDLIINDGWYEQPSADGKWHFHRHRFSQARGGAQMYAYDVDDDGDQDVISAIDAHGWGIAWYEAKQVNNSIRFREHPFVGDREQEAQFGIAFSQPHALAVADIDGDGVQDVISGKRRWAHGPKGDIEPNAEPVVVWFRLTRDQGQVKFEPHVVDRESGVGVQIQAVDVNQDGRIDILTASKLGTFVFLQQTDNRK